MADRDVVKKGKLGRPKVPPQIPDRVWEHIDDLIYNEDADWMQFEDQQGQEWVLVKLWRDDSEFEVVAAKVEYQSQVIKDGINNVDPRPKEKPAQFSGTYYDVFER